MIVPRSRLLFWSAIVVLPFAFLAAVAPGVGRSGAGVHRRTCPGGNRRCGRCAPEVWRALASNCRPWRACPKIARRNWNCGFAIGYNGNGTLRLGLPWPREIRASSDELDATLPAQSEWSRLIWLCTPLKRGNYKFNMMFVEGAFAARLVVGAQSGSRASGNPRLSEPVDRAEKSRGAVFETRPVWCPCAAAGGQGPGF